MGVEINLLAQCFIKSIMVTAMAILYKPLQDKWELKAHYINKTLPMKDRKMNSKMGELVENSD